jgi:hypothetical protein
MALPALLALPVFPVHFYLFLPTFAVWVAFFVHSGEESSLASLCNRLLN